MPIPYEELTSHLAKLEDQYANSYGVERMKLSMKVKALRIEKARQDKEQQGAKPIQQ